MNEEESKIRKLWDFMDVQDGRLLVRVSNVSDKTEDIIIVSRLQDGRLEHRRVSFKNGSRTTVNEWLLEYGEPFLMVQQRDEEGHFIIPDTDEWRMEEEMDH